MKLFISLCALLTLSGCGVFSIGKASSNVIKSTDYAVTEEEAFDTFEDIMENRGIDYDIYSDDPMPPEVLLMSMDSAFEGEFYAEYLIEENTFIIHIMHDYYVDEVQYAIDTNTVTEEYYEFIMTFYGIAEFVADNLETPGATMMYMHPTNEDELFILFEDGVLTYDNLGLYTDPDMYDDYYYW